MLELRSGVRRRGRAPPPPPIAEVNRQVRKGAGSLDKAVPVRGRGTGAAGKRRGVAMTAATGKGRGRRVQSKRGAGRLVEEEGEEGKGLEQGKEVVGEDEKGGGGRVGDGGEGGNRGKELLGDNGRGGLSANKAVGLEQEATTGVFVPAEKTNGKSNGNQNKENDFLRCLC